MPIRVKLMGTLRYKLPPEAKGTLDMEEASMTVARVLESLEITEGQVHMVVVNGEMTTDRQYELKDGDNVTIFPPVAGG